MPKPLEQEKRKKIDFVWHMRVCKSGKLHSILKKQYHHHEYMLFIEIDVLLSSIEWIDFFNQLKIEIELAMLLVKNEPNEGEIEYSIPSISK